MSVTDIGPLALELPNALIETLAQRVAAIVLQRLEDTTERRWLTVDQAADYIGRSPDAIRGLVKRRELTGYKPDGRLQLERTELDQWMRGERDA